MPASNKDVKQAVPDVQEYSEVALVAAVVAKVAKVSARISSGDVLKWSQALRKLWAAGKRDDAKKLIIVTVSIPPNRKVVVNLHSTLDALSYFSANPGRFA